MGLYYGVRVLGTIMQVLYDNGTYGYVCKFTRRE